MARISVLGSLIFLSTLCFRQLTTAQIPDNDVSASFDYDGVLILDSHNFKGMTQSGVWVVLFYSYSIVIKNITEAENCQTIMWIWGDYATRTAKLGGTPTSGDRPTIHIAKYDTTSENERQFLSQVLRSERIESLPAIIVFDGKTVRAMPTTMMDEIILNFPDIDRLKGYNPDMKCDFPADHFEALAKHMQIMEYISYFVNDYLLVAYGVALAEPHDSDEPDSKFYSQPDPPMPFPPDNPDELLAFDPTDQVLEVAYEAARTGEVAPLRALLTRMEAVNGTGVNCRNPYTLQTPLHIAIAGGRNDVVELLLSLGADPNAVCADGEPALVKAAEHGRRGAARLLLRAGARVDAPRERDGASALHMAALVGHGDVCRLLLRAGADVEARTPKGDSALHFAVAGGHWRSGAAEQLLAHGADLEARDYFGRTPLAQSVYYGVPDFTGLLLDLGADPSGVDWSGDTPLHHAMYCGLEDQVEALLRRGADPRAVNRLGERAMDTQSAFGNARLDPMTKKPVATWACQRRLNAILRPYRHWWLPLYWFGPYLRGDVSFALQRGEAAAVAWAAARLRDFGAYLSGRFRHFYRPMLGGGLGSWLRCSLERFSRMRLLEVEEFHDKQTPGGDPKGDVWLFYMGDPTYERLKSYSELQRAVALDRPDVVEELLRAGRAEWAEGAPGSLLADAQQVLIPSNGGGLVPHGRGALRDQGGTVDIEVRDERGATPLVMAARRGDAHMVDLLARWGAELDAVDDAGGTALKHAAGEGRLPLVEQLLRLGAAPDVAPAADGERTALMAACAGGHREVVRALLRHGADLDRQDAVGRTPLNYAADAGRDELARWLRNRGAAMRTPEGDLRGFPAALDDEERSHYTPVDQPTRDRRNPRYTGPMR